MPAAAPSRACVTVKLSMTALPSARCTCGGASHPSTCACSSALLSRTHAAGLVEYTPAEYLLM